MKIQEIKEKLKPGVYVRTEDGYIAQYIGEDKSMYVAKPHYSFNSDMFDSSIYESDEANFLWDTQLHWIININTDIIELIKPGDYVNGRLVKSAGYNAYDEWCVTLEQYGEWCKTYIYPDEIKKIVTKERFEKESFDI